MDAKHSSLRLSILSCALGGALAIAVAGGGAAAEAAPPTDARQQMVAVLAAAEPHPALGDQARIWDRFVGTWDADFGFFADDGSVRHQPGELEFGWVLDGLAVQDLWIGYPRNGRTERSIGTSLRYYDTEAKTWRVVFVNPRFGASLGVAGGLEGDRIVLRGSDADGSSLRWSFNDLQADSFTWRGERSRDGGKTWRLEEEHHMRRRAVADSAKSALAFTRLASLVGKWTGEQAGTPFEVTYTLTADGSALMEEFRPQGGAVMVTMFSVDGDHIVATHYCSAKNQPQMASAAIADPAAKSLAFSLVRVTGLHTPADWHNTGLTVTMDDADHLTQEWTYAFRGETGTNTFHLTRAR